MSEQKLGFRAQISPDHPVIETTYGDKVVFDTDDAMLVPIYIRFKKWPFAESSPPGNTFEVSPGTKAIYTVDKKNGNYTYYLYFLNPFSDNGPTPPPMGTGDMDVDPPPRTGNPPDRNNVNADDSGDESEDHDLPAVTTGTKGGVKGGR